MGIIQIIIVQTGTPGRPHLSTSPAHSHTAAGQVHAGQAGGHVRQWWQQWQLVQVRQRVPRLRAAGAGAAPREGNQRREVCGPARQEPGQIQQGRIQLGQHSLIPVGALHGQQAMDALNYYCMTKLV